MPQKFIKTSNQPKKSSPPKPLKNTHFPDGFNITKGMKKAPK